MADQAEQTTLVHNEEETFALEPIDITGNAAGFSGQIQHSSILLFPFLCGNLSLNFLHSTISMHSSTSFLMGFLLLSMNKIMS